MAAEARRSRAAEADPLAVLEVIDRLEVGPVELESDRLKMPYVVHRDGAVDATELVYRYEEDVFDPDEATSSNLASWIGAQVALNYGLFCREIVFRGAFDAVDRAFLETMAANTAREIYVKKFLEPNPFLRGPASELPVVRRRSYLRATLTFPDLLEPARGGDLWEDEEDRAAVLSSGGKDSLLSFGLLDELGCETHSVFVNESGRHWYTALNAYRYLRAERPETTSRVWTSSDRLFAWMLRHLPFVRPDFARVRSDEYPIRLWTVAVFLAGAVPVLRKRGLGLLAIGDEFDTTYRTRFQGVIHYDGLYDQSRYFDAALSRYFQRKGWPVRQFSLLRPLSELLIEKTLVERYPELQRRQMSCHATHVDGERVLPCGKCEKCRRIVGMLRALGADPRECGYSEAQIESCLESLARSGVHQQSAGVEHLAWMLVDRGVLPEPGEGLGRARRRDEIMRLRFDERASPIDTVPRELRRGILEILLQHAEGAFLRAGRGWVDFDPLADPAVRGDDQEGSGESAGADDVSWGELSWVQARERLRSVDIALLPVGAVEQHGPHLPLDTDAWDAEYFCRRVAAACTDPKPLVLPLVPYGVSYHHDSFAGTLSVGPEALADFVYDIGMSAARHGITKLVIVNGHGGNGPALQVAAQRINRDARIFTCVDSGETSDADIDALTATPNDVHAGEVETSTSLATRPHLVDMSLAEPAVPEFSTRYLDFTSAHGIPWYEHTAKISSSGVLGDPTRATAEKGEKIWEIMVDHLRRLVEAVKDLGPHEIYESRH